jgi:hypothetical protein
MQKIVLALLMALLKWMLSVAGIRRWLIVAGLVIGAAFFLVPVLVALAIAASAVAIYLFIQNRKKAEELKRRQQRKDAADGD